MRDKADEMYRRFGKLEGKRCKDCIHLCSYSQSRTWYKCELYGISRSEATDWGKNYTSCGFFNVDARGMNPVYKQIRERTKDDNKPLPDQMTMFDC